MRVTDWREVFASTQPSPPAEITFAGGWFPRIAGRASGEIVADLASSWSAFRAPFLQQFAAAILDRQLTAFSFDTRGQQWLTFEKPRTSSLHLAPPQPIPESLRGQFPFERVDGLAQFIEHFGGLAEGCIPPGPHFWPGGECRVVVENCPHYDWGLIGDWAGALPIYSTGTGNILVISPDNRCAKWDHDIGWESKDEDPFEPLHWSMGELTEAFLKFVSVMDPTARKASLAVRESPFYY